MFYYYTSTDSKKKNNKSFVWSHYLCSSDIRTWDRNKTLRAEKLQLDSFWYLYKHPPLIGYQNFCRELRTFLEKMCNSLNLKCTMRF